MPVVLRRVKHMSAIHRHHTSDFLCAIGVPHIKPATSVFDPGYDALTLAGHLEQSSHLISILKISMACWLIANEDVVRGKVATAKSFKVPTVTGGGPFEIA